MTGCRTAPRLLWLPLLLGGGLLINGCAGADFARILSPEGELVLSVVVDLADEEDERSRGLRGRSRLGPEEGLLFLCPSAVEACIDTAGVPFEIDVVFFDDAGRVIRVERAVAAEDPSPRCQEGVRSLLEVSAGVASDVRSGDALQTSAPVSM